MNGFVRLYFQKKNPKKSVASPRGEFRSGPSAIAKCACVDTSGGVDVASNHVLAFIEPLASCIPPLAPQFPQLSTPLSHHLCSRHTSSNACFFCVEDARTATATPLTAPRRRRRWRRAWGWAALLVRNEDAVDERGSRAPRSSAAMGGEVTTIDVAIPSGAGHPNYQWICGSLHLLRRAWRCVGTRGSGNLIWCSNLICDDNPVLYQAYLPGYLPLIWLIFFFLISLQI